MAEETANWRAGGSCSQQTGGAVEFFLGALKTEYLCCFHFASANELFQRIPECVHFCNFNRISLKNGLTPIEFRHKTA